MTLPVSATEKQLEAIPLPDVRQPEQTPYWPAWVASRIDSVTMQTQPDKTTGRWREIPTLPASLLLKPEEGVALERYAVEVEALCSQTPAVGPDVEKEMLAVLAEMMMALPSSSQSEIGAEVRGESFLIALKDLPPWAVRAAIRRWYRGDCGTDNRGQPYNYHWCPAPAELRRVAVAELDRVKTRMHQARLLLRAERRRELDEPHGANMSERFAELLRTLKASPVG